MFDLQEITKEYGSSPVEIISTFQEESIIRILKAEDSLKFDFDTSIIDINPQDADINGYLDSLDFHKAASSGKEWIHLCSQNSNPQKEDSPTIEVVIHVSEARKILQDYLQKREARKSDS